MVEVLKCPSCGTPTLAMKESGDLLCTSCSTTYVLSPSQADFLLCPRCGFRNEPEASVCNECGGEFAKYCPGCGARLELQMRFCDQCGASYEGLSSPDGDCQWCGYENVEEARSCDKCGARLIIACPSCQAEMKAGLDFCRVCGLDYATLLEGEGEED